MTHDSWSNNFLEFDIFSVKKFVSVDILFGQKKDFRLTIFWGLKILLLDCFLGSKIFKG